VPSATDTTNELCSCEVLNWGAPSGLRLSSAADDSTRLQATRHRRADESTRVQSTLLQADRAYAVTSLFCCRHRQNTWRRLRSTVQFSFVARRFACRVRPVTSSYSRRAVKLSHVERRWTAKLDFTRAVQFNNMTKCSC